MDRMGRIALAWVLESRLRVVLASVVVAGVLAAVVLAAGNHGARIQGGTGAVPPVPVKPAASSQQASQGSAAAAGADSWLPFTQQDLADAGAVTARFCADYNTYSYTESTAAYVGKMSALITGPLAATLQDDYSDPGVARLRAAQKQVSTGTAVIGSLRAFGPSSLTFIVDATQQLVTSGGTTNGSEQYAVTVTGVGPSWQVSDIELASAGNS